MRNEIAHTIGSVPCTSIPGYYFLRQARRITAETEQSTDDLWYVDESSLAVSKVATDMQDMIVMSMGYREAVGAVLDREKRRIERFLYTAFDSEPLEDGMDHPAEDVIADALKINNKRQLLWFREFSLDSKRPAFAASVLRCLGRISELGTETWRVDLVRAALDTDNVQIRDAAVQAAEHWGDHGLIEVLQRHNDTEQWITDYIDMVIDDIATS